MINKTELLKYIVFYILKYLVCGKSFELDNN